MATTYITYTNIGFGLSDQIVHQEDLYLLGVWTNSIEEIKDECYKLTNCVSQEYVFVHGIDLEKYICKSLKVCVDEVEICIYITKEEPEGDDECIDISSTIYNDMEILYCYDDCEECLPKNKKLFCPTPPIGRTLKPGWHTGICDNRIYEKISCNYSESMFQKMMSKRYNIKPCNKVDIKDSIKYELMNLEMIK